MRSNSVPRPTLCQMRRAIGSFIRSIAIAVVFLTLACQHAVPKPSLVDLWDLLRFDGFVVDALHAAE